MLMRALPTAVEEVEAISAVSAMLEIFAKDIEAQATEVTAHAWQEGGPGFVDTSGDYPGPDVTACHG